MKELFNTKEEIETAVAHFKALKTNAGWQLLEDIVGANIKILEEQILNGFEEETKEEIDRKRDKLKAYKEVIGTPDYWIEKLKDPEPFDDENDPYHTLETLHKARRN
jgi:hypothetical protein